MALPATSRAGRDRRASDRFPNLSAREYVSGCMAEAARTARESSPGGFEFSDVHKDSFRALSQSMSFLGVCLMLLGGLAAVFALGAIYEGLIPNGLFAVIYAVLLMIMAAWMLSAGRSLSAMMRTRGRDVDYLMEAVQQLRRLFGMTLVLLMIGMLGTVAVVAWCALGGSGRCLGLFG